MKHRLLVVLDSSNSADRVAEYVARAFAGVKDEEAGLVLFTVLPELPPWVEAGEAGAVIAQRHEVDEAARDSAERRLSNTRSYLMAQGVNPGLISMEICDNPGAIVREIVETAARKQCDTIVMARHHKSMVREFFAGDTEEKLLRHPTGFTVWLIE